MDRNDLLAATRDHFLRSFTDALQPVIDGSVDALYKKAERAHLSVDQHRIFDARTVLTSRGAQLKTLCVRNLEQLLNRGFQTAYSTFRQSGAANQKASSLSLLDVSAVEDDLRMASITGLFRDEADEELRDLNIRVALLFDQENIKERENPFRPYVLSRSISRSAEMLDLQPDIALILTDQLCESLIPRVAGIYGGLNALLSHHGIAAQLQLKIRKSADQGPITSSGPITGSGENDDMPSKAAPRTTQDDTDSRGEQDVVARAQAEIQARNEARALLQAQSKAKSQRRVSRLIDWVSTGRGAATERTDALLNSFGPLQPGEFIRSSDDADQGQSSAPAWLSSGERASDVLRRAFLSGIESVVPSHADALNFDGSSAGQGGASGRPLSEQLAGGRLTRSVQVMVRAETPAATEMFHADGSIRNLILEQRQELNELTDAEQERMTIDIVAMLFEFILRDNKVPAEVRAQLGRLQFLVLKTALRDPSFFNHKSHPARLLVNRIGSISLSLKQVDPSGDRLTAEICRIVEVLLADTEERTELFAQVLDEFDQFVARELRTSDEDVERAVLAMESVESRTLQFARITSMIADGMAMLKVDPKLHHFIVHTWAHVVERAGRTDTTESRRFRALVPDLIWSIAPKAVEIERKRLLKMLPHILATLKAGMTLLDWEQEKQQEFLGWLIDSHTYALRALILVGTAPPLSFIQDIFKAFVDNASFDADTAVESKPDSGGIELVMGPAFSTALMADAIREMKLQINVLDDLFEDDVNLINANSGATVSAADVNKNAMTMATMTTDAGANTVAQTSGEESDVMARLQVGVAVEVNLHGRPTQAKLNWVSPNAASLLLTMEDSTKPSVITAKLFHWLLRSGRARFIEVTPLFERAVKSLLESADEIDKDDEVGVAA